MTTQPRDIENNEPAGPSRRFFVTASAAVGGLALAQGAARAGIVRTDFSNLPPYGNGTLPPGVRSRAISNVNGMTVHILEAGFETPGRQAVVLLHGFPELAYSWRKVMPVLAAAGYHVIAPDQRGYGRTTGWDDSFDDDPDQFRILNMVRDAIGLVYALGYRQVAAIAGHDAGSPVASWAALIRPDIFQSVAILSSPFGGTPALPFNTANGAAPPRPAPTDDELDAELAKLDPPRKYYQNYQRKPGANEDMLYAPQGLHNFFRAYYHYKSADWKGNKPVPLKARTAEEMAKIPTYYVMELNKGMAATAASAMPSAAEIAACKWLTEAEVEVYAIAGKSDWGVYQTPGLVENMRAKFLTQMLSFNLIDGAGHWVQQEQPEQVSKLLLEFLQNPARKG
jgi:pimeloyl-ACP methyl ester carboxylesterase